MDTIRTMDKNLEVIDLGSKPYMPVFEMQKDMARRRRDGEITDTLLLVEHEPVYTLGLNADDNNVTASEEELKAMGIEVVNTSRGGDVTYHGPGQLVGYPIIDIGETRKVLWYVGNLETVLIQTLATYDIEATTDPANRGVWVGDNKIAAIGVRVTRRITMHGFALNVRTDLNNYAGIVPCGIQNKGVTSLHNIVPDITMEDVKQRVVDNFRKVFEYGEIQAC